VLSFKLYLFVFLFKGHLVVNEYRENQYRLLFCGLFPVLIGFTWGLSPAINWSSLSPSIFTFLHYSSIPLESTHQLVSEPSLRFTMPPFFSEDDLGRLQRYVIESIQRSMKELIERHFKEILDNKSSTGESSLQNTVQISSPKPAPLAQSVTQSTNNPCTSNPNWHKPSCPPATPQLSYQPQKNQPKII